MTKRTKYTDGDRPKKSSKNHDDDDDDDSSSKTSLPLWMMILVLWFLLGLIAKLVSLYCSIRRKFNNPSLKGLFIAAVTGPFYFLYLMMSVDEGNKC